MKLGIDFDGTEISYLVCYKHGSGDGLFRSGLLVTLEQAKSELNSMIKKDKERNKTQMKYWIMKYTKHYERVFEKEGDE